MSNSSHVCVYIRSTQITETKQAKSEAFRQLVPTEEEVGRQHIREWTGLEFAKSQRAVENRGEKKEEIGCEIVCCAPATLMVEG